MLSTSGLYTLSLIVLALIAGALVPFQAGTNAILGRTLGHPLWATVASLCVSLICILPLILALRLQLPKLDAAVQAPTWIWFGGLAGVIFITAALMLVPRLGGTGFIACVIAGQMVTALIIDHFGLMGLAEKSASLGRISGVLVIFAGVIIIQRFTPPS
ncbi:DMT family transporter [Klebsiella sp. BIGb0407]|uniref:DMT family transporter n=1 Tax=Klebsiella sp. BIGb0407 TaxID=2940603 RepID=UPI0021684FD7|nr:DMT family transporter [Klebsiella sp. BIGb0407]MCS3429793.1 transporter family-2 protein [Klebsiella sp. BIGb0407]